MSFREVTKTEAGREYQTDLLTKEVKRLRKTLSKQISLFDGLTNNAAEPKTVKQELEKLNKNFTELSSVSARLSNLLSEEEAEQINYVVEMEGKNVEKIEKAVRDWLGAKDKVGPSAYRSHESKESTYSSIEDLEGMTEVEKGQKQQNMQNNMGLTIQFMSKHSSLEKQIGLSDELLMTNDTSLIKREVAKLKQVFEEVCQISIAVREGLSTMESTKILNIMKTTEVKVEKIIEAAREFISEGDRDSIISQVSRRSKISVHSEMFGRRPSRYDKKKIREYDERSFRSEPGRQQSRPRKYNNIDQDRYKGKKWESPVEDGYEKRVSRSERYLMSTTNRLSKHITDKMTQNTESENAVHELEEDLAVELSDVLKRMREKINSVRDLINRGEIEGIHGNMQYLNKLRKKRETSVLILYKILPEEEAKGLAEKVTRDDGEISEIEDLVGKLMVKKLMETEELMERGSQKSKPSHRSGVSQCSSRDDLSEYSARLSRHSRKDTLEDRETVFQTQNLKERFSIFQKDFKDQKKTCIELIRSNGLITSGKELQKLEETYQAMADTAGRLREQLPSIEAEDINLQIEMEDTEVFEVKKRMIKQMARGDDRREEKDHLYTRTEDIKENERHIDKDEGRLKGEMTRMKIRLDNQKDLIDDLLMTNNRELINRELQTLDKVYNDFVAITAQIRDIVSEEDADAMSKIISVEDNEVFRKKKLVSQFMMTHAEKEISKNRKELDASMRKAVGGSDEKEKIVYGEGGKIEMNNPKNTEVTNLMRLNELMVQTLKLQAAPKVEIDIFRGEPLEYTYFIENFKDVVENLVDNPRQRLVRLLKYTEGDAKDLIKHCVHEESTTCYSTAINLLEKEYGNPYTISCAYLEKLKSWPQIKSNDGVALKGLYRFLLQCSSYQKRGNIDLNSPLTIRSIQLSLPVNMQDSWTTRVSKIRKKRMREATFSDFVEFVDEWCQSSNDPVYARGGFKDKNEKMKACATDVEEKDRGMEGKDKDINRKKCPLCAMLHDLDECSTFIDKTARDKKDFLFKAKMCFCCYSKDHLANKCNTKRICKTCGEAHPTGLHGVSFKVSVVQQGGSAMCIVPVRLRHKTWENKEIEVYAMLDECSEGTFISESLLDELEDVTKRKTSVIVETVNHKGVVDAYAVKDLIVRGSKEFGERYNILDDIKLPETFSQEKIPMDKEDVPTPEILSKWTYLKEVAQTIPGVKDIPLGLLIGNNCPKAQEPIEVVSSQNNGPYAKRTRLGWCVSAPSQEEGLEVAKCCNIKVLGTCVKDISISTALQEMWRTDFIERESEKRALSKEDRMFLDEMKRSIDIDDGHYVLPLPLRKQTRNTSMNSETKVDREKSLWSAHDCQSISKGSEVVTGKEEQSWNTRGEPVSKSSHSKKVNIVHPEEHTSSTLGDIDCIVMPDNRGQVLHRLKCIKRKMLKEKKFRDDYCGFMETLFGAGHARKVPEERLGERSWYIPHHGVYHPAKKKIRVVFDCSAEKDGVSLNSVLMQGPDFMNSLLGVLLRFRIGLIPVMADIEAMYYQVKIPEEHCKFLRFFWWEGGKLDDEPVECEMCVHPFGAISSKNCVIFALHQTAFDNRSKFGEEAMKTLLRDFYVDDLLKSVDKEDELGDLIRNIVGMCTAGGFNLTKFICTHPNVLRSIPMERRAAGMKVHQIGCSLPTESALGVRWHMHDDSFGFNVSFESDDGTRSGCLSTISRIHDPLGIAAPFLLPGRKILQKMTAKSARWDDPLPPEMAKVWSNWRNDMLLLNELRIRRSHRSSTFEDIADVTLHCFSDASFVGYGVACYLRMVDVKGKVEVSLVMGKSRVSPLKPTTVPRLELTAGTVSAKIAAMLVEELKIPEIKVYYWIDNKIVLGYIYNERRRFRIFVANRVQIIDAYTEKEQWGYVDTKDNPSDYASRGISPKDTEKVYIWINGPDFLRERDEEWKHAHPEVEVSEDDVEVKVETKVNATGISNEWPSVLEVLEERISSWHRMRRVIVWVLRFLSKEWRMVKRDEVTVSEIQQAETKIIKLMQERAYKKEIQDLHKGNQRKGVKTLRRLNPFIDEEGLLRVGGRLANAQENDSFRFPVLIPKKAVATRVMIEWHHAQIEHRGKHTTVSRIREFGFWVVNAGKEVGGVVYRCVRCKWLRGKLNNQKMADLPFDRTLVVPPFTYCGVDVFGPIQVKDGRRVLKRYGALFTCFSLRAVHIELLASLETDSFIQALRRFIARRGAVRKIRSDNGTNFVGAESELKKAMEEMDQEKIGNFLTEQGCDYVTWERNTPLASHMGGVWERQIRTVKSVVCSLLKSSPRRLDEESLRTFLTEAESIVNSRPLTLESLHDPECMPLCPNQILTMKTKVVMPPPGVFQGEGVYARKRWRVVQHLANAFWSRWRKEYLQVLQSRQKWTEKKRNLQVDDVVLMKDEGAPRGQWPMARVVEAYESKDGLVRSVSLYAKGSTFKRPVHKTVLLVARSEDSN